MSKSIAKAEAALKRKENAAAVKALLRLDMKSRFGYGAKVGAGNVGKWIMNLLFTTAMYVVIIFLIYLFTKMFVVRPGLRDSYIILVSMASLILQFFICTTTLIKALYFSGDNEILLRFPVNGTQIFIAKSIFVMINNFVISLALLMPFYICYGVLLKLDSSFYIWAVFVSVCITVISRSSCDISFLLRFFCRTIRSLPTSVPALSVNRLLGKRIADTRSA